MTHDVVADVLAQLEDPSWATEQMWGVVHDMPVSTLALVWNALDERLDEHLTCVDRIVFQVYAAARLGMDIRIQSGENNKKVGSFVSNTLAHEIPLRATKVQWVRSENEQSNLFREMNTYLGLDHAKLLLPFWSAPVWISNASVFRQWLNPIEREVDRIDVLPLGEIRWMNHDSIQQFVPEVHSNLSSLLQAEDWTAQLIRYHVHERTRSLQQVALPAMLDFN